MRKPGLYLTLTLLLLAAGCGTDDLKPNFVLISIDTLRADHLGCYGYDAWETSPTPVMDGLALEGVLFERCYAPRGQTNPSVASMLTGVYPITHTLRENGHWLPTRYPSFIQLLKARGYETAGFASNLHKEKDPRNKKSDPSWWTRGLDTFGDGYGGKFWYEAKLAPIQDQWTWDERTEKQTLDWIEKFEAKGKPFFLWTHFYDPHKPYLPHDSFTDYFPSYEGPMKPEIGLKDDKPVDRVTPYLDEHTRAGRALGPDDFRKVMALYDASVNSVDGRLNRLLEALGSKGMLDNTWIIVTSDHGDELGDHNHYYYHGASIYDAVLHIPLIIKGPDTVPGRRVRGLVQNVDIAPTILQLADISPLATMEGIPFHETLKGGAEMERTFITAEWQHRFYAYSDGTYKYIYNPNRVCPMKPPFNPDIGGFPYETDELYHLDTDPGEKNNVFNEQKEVGLEMRKMLGRWVRQEGHDPSGKKSVSPRSINEAIRALGYTGADRAGEGAGPLDDD